jgi:hypothetical protein
LFDLGAIVANEETGFGTIKCPSCGETIPISEAIHHQIAERTRQEFKAEALEAKRLLVARERELNEKAAALDQMVLERVTAERVNLTKELEAQLRSGFSTEIADLKRQADERSERLAQAQAVELELRTEKRNLEEREKVRDLEMVRKLDEERMRLQQEISTRLEEEHARQVAEKDKRLSDAMKANDELRRKLQQGSQQLQGEVLELALQDLISQAFPMDLVQPVPKGINGADIIQRVRTQCGDLAGSIIWETKRTKAWNDSWIEKIKDDQRQAKADIAIVVSDALPKDCTQFKQLSGIWVTHPRCAIHLASALRVLLLEVASARRAAVGKNEKMEILYAYLSGMEFRQRVDAIVEAFVSMQEDLQEERRSTERRWAKREKTIQRVITNTSGMYGDLQGLVGSSLPTIPALTSADDRAAP